MCRCLWAVRAFDGCSPQPRLRSRSAPASSTRLSADTGGRVAAHQLGIESHCTGFANEYRYDSISGADRAGIHHVWTVRSLYLAPTGRKQTAPAHTGYTVGWRHSSGPFLRLHTSHAFARHARLYQLQPRAGVLPVRAGRPPAERLAGDAHAARPGSITAHHYAGRAALRLEPPGPI